jgi:hypothetical protein
MQSTQAHRVHSHFHAAAVNAAQHGTVAELGNEGLNFLEQLGAIAQANDQHMCAA